MKKGILAAAFAVLLFAQGAKAQTNLQVFYDFGKDRQYVTTTFEMFKGDEYGDTFFFIDHYYATKEKRDLDLYSATGGSYFEIERGINMWQDSDLKDFSALIEYDGSTWGWGILGVGAKYFFHSDDYNNTFTAALLYDAHFGGFEPDVPIKFSGVWGFNDLFGAKGLTFKGFFDIWGNKNYFGLEETNVSFLSEPQLWYAVGEHLNLGGEIELSYNFAGKGFMCNPCLGVKWNF